MLLNPISMGIASNLMQKRLDDHYNYKHIDIISPHCYLNKKTLVRSQKRPQNSRETGNSIEYSPTSVSQWWRMDFRMK